MASLMTSVMSNRNTQFEIGAVSAKGFIVFFFWPLAALLLYVDSCLLSMIFTFLTFGFCSFTGFTQKNIGRAIKYIASSFSTQFEIEQVGAFRFPDIFLEPHHILILQLREFADEHVSELGTSTRAVQQAIEAAEANLMWMEKNYEKIWRWLEVQNSRLY